MMKKIFYLVLGFMFIISLSALNETKTIDETDFQAIQTACDGGDDLIYHYYEQCVISANQSREDWEPLVDDMGTREDYFASKYANKAMVCN